MNRLNDLSGPPRVLSLRSESSTKTMNIGRLFGSILPAGSAVSLEGGLGAGKTLFAGGICEGLGIKEEVLSPTFILLEEYKGLFPVLHFDLYRLEKIEDVRELGLFDAADGRNVILVEWGDRLPDCVMEFDIHVDIKIINDDERRISFKGPDNLIRTLMEDDIELDTFYNGN
ncbi:MAG: tRNA (adenosine(37)-N6)-threonylcarbamoyltransferase complex ATPase subunit type 1 TsaE [Candidatus Krumholzibacteriota bacterium]|nr:tRNA (adenosine(37)-N6)-threonylcarbamoyltransferase complex ATPase subunit type 1 TsaE [Candidatus Krumholzibacteriota bacterium]